uniref:CXXC motif containing zinc binding protein n=1 Tax=Strigamia maritima TaxID=126957 RepID=T1JP18_STRMM
MVKIGLQIQANLENVTDLIAKGEDFRWHLKLRCLNCGEETDKWQYLTEVEKSPLKGSRGEASLVSKCKLCARENSIDIVDDSKKAYSNDDKNKLKTIIVFDCRGFEPSAFEPRNGWIARGVDTGTQFNDIDLTEKEWVDYDEKLKEPVGIYDVTYKFVKL